MTIKDFKAGATAYGLTLRKTWSKEAKRVEREEIVEEYIVGKVTRKYVYAARLSGIETKFAMERNYAIYGTGYHNDDIRLFPSRQAIDDWKEIEELRCKIHNACDYGGINRGGV